MRTTDAGIKTERAHYEGVHQILVNLSVLVIAIAPYAMPQAVGTYTTLSGFYDFQLSGGSCQYIRVNSSGEAIHVIYTVGLDSVRNTRRRTAYALSTDGGVTWNSFNQLYVPDGLGFDPSLDVGQGQIQGGAIIGNTSSSRIPSLFLDYPEGSGSFQPVAVPVFPEPYSVMPALSVVSCADGEILGAGTVATGVYAFRTNDPTGWRRLTSFGGYVVAAGNSQSRVGIAWTEERIGIIESTNNGVSWPDTPTVIRSLIRIEGQDTFLTLVGLDVAYLANELLLVADETRLNLDPTIWTDSSQIAFWSRTTGWKAVATKRTTPNVPSIPNRPQSQHSAISWPAIGTSGNTIVVAYVAMQRETSAAGFNYCDISMVTSADSGRTWSQPVNLTNSNTLDERYPSVAKWNPPGQVNLVWQEDSEPGSALDDAPLSRARQVLYRHVLTRVQDAPLATEKFRLELAYPNPFNPTTTISFTLPSKSFVSLKIFDALGREVSILVSEELPAGTYSKRWNAEGLASGVYYSCLQAGKFLETKKLILLR